MNEKVASQTDGSVRLQTLAILLGSAVPIQIMGRAAIAGALLMAFLCFLSLPGKSLYVQRAIGAARSPVGVMLLVVFIFWLPNIFQSIDPLRSLETMARSFVFVGLATLFWAVLVENKPLHGLALRALVLTSTLSIVIAIIAEVALPELYWLLHFRGWTDIPLGSSLKPFSALAVFLIPVFIWTGIRLTGGWTVLAIANVIGFLVLVWLTYNRATIAGLLGMMVVAAILTAWSSRSPIIKVALPLGTLAALVGVLIWFNMTRQRPDFGGDWFFPLWLVDYQRQTIWNFALELIQRNFWFGMGVNTINFAPGADAVIPQTATNLKMIPSHPHNWMLEVAAETGIFGLLSLLGVLALTLTRYIRVFIRNNNGAYFITACMATGYWVSGLFNFSFWSSWWQMSFVLMVALCLSQSSQPALGNNQS